MTTYPTAPPRTITTTQLRNGAWIADEERAELESKAKAYDELEAVMPQCGHKQRYVYGTVTMNCALCVVEGLTQKTNRKYNRRK